MSLHGSTSLVLYMEKQAQTEPALQLPASSCPGPVLVLCHPLQGALPSRALSRTWGDKSMPPPLPEGSALPGTSCWALRPRCPRFSVSNPPENNPVSKRLSPKPSYSPHGAGLGHPNGCEKKTPPLQAGIRKKLESCCLLHSHSLLVFAVIF